MPKLRRRGCNGVATGHTESYFLTVHIWTIAVFTFALPNMPVLHRLHPWGNSVSWSAIFDDFLDVVWFLQTTKCTLVDRQLCWQRVPRCPREHWRSDRGQRQSQRGQVPPGERKGTLSVALSWKDTDRRDAVSKSVCGVFPKSRTFSANHLSIFDLSWLPLVRENTQLGLMIFFRQQLQDMLKLVVPGWVRPAEMCLGASVLHDVAI